MPSQEKRKDRGIVSVGRVWAGQATPRVISCQGGGVILGYIRRRTNRRLVSGGRLRPSPAPRPMPELPEVETTLRGIAPLVVGRRVAAMHLYDRRLRWSVPRWLPARIAGRTIDALDRRSKYLLFRLAERHAARPFRDDRQPAGPPRAAAAPYARSCRHRPRFRRDAALPRPAPLRGDALAAVARRGPPASREPRPGAVRPGLRRRLPVGAPRDGAPRRSNWR